MVEGDACEGTIGAPSRVPGEDDRSACTRPSGQVLARDGAGSAASKEVSRIIAAWSRKALTPVECREPGWEEGNVWECSL